ncbi:hypothetical protein R1T16_15940 [Flavobacterium sp. DG1-102-2]|uniref:hypothetical protein n=1 Tax=Flavobacterium sp. DG1-102-2 TaxID=3081663 RepID=UPI00294A59B7|nr:hypothetical protein [Flavobacterium sp. DG1-102-2]MDV6169929.1 hypothetical protein [Flavobacterium sp. DG1-102-2]
MQKQKSYSLAAIACVGIIGFMATHFFGGMILWTLSYWFIIVPLLIIYIISFFSAVADLFDGGYYKSRIKINMHLITFVLIIVFNLYDSELFKNNKILSATLKDDLYHYTLILREGGKCETQCAGMFGYEESFKGNYKFKGDTIIFSKVPYDNVGFIPDTILYDREQKALFIEKDQEKKFIREKNFLNHFEIDK